MRSRRFSMFLAALAFCGCSAEMVQSRQRVRGPISAVQWIDAGGGEFRYSNSGPGWIVRSRRRDALAKMSEYCDNKYKIVDEVDRDDADAPFTKDDVTQDLSERHYDVQRYHHVYFECQ